MQTNCYFKDFSRRASSKFIYQHEILPTPDNRTKVPPVSSKPLAEIELAKKAGDAEFGKPMEVSKRDKGLEFSNKFEAFYKKILYRLSGSTDNKYIVKLQEEYAHYEATLCALTKKERGKLATDTGFVSDLASVTARLKKEDPKNIDIYAHRTTLEQESYFK